MTSYTAIQPRPHAPLTVPDPATLSQAFPGMACAIFPNPAFASEPVQVYLRLEAPPQEYEWRLAVGDDGWRPWQPAARPFTLAFTTPGATVTLFIQARRAASESPIAAAQLTISSVCMGAAGPGEPLSLTFLEHGRVIAVCCADGVLYLDRQTGDRRFLRTTTGASDKVLVARDGKAVTAQQILVTDAQGWPVSRPHITVHDSQTGALVAEFTPDLNEKLAGITPAGELILTARRGAPPIPNAFQKRTAFSTRIVHPGTGQILALHQGQLIAVANGRGVLLYEEEPAFAFLPDYLDSGASARAATFPAMSKAPRDLRACLAPSANLVAVAGSHVHTIAGRTLAVPEYTIVRFTTGRALTTLRAKRVEQFADDDLVWVSDHTERRLADCLKLYDWRLGRAIAAPPVYALAHAAGLIMNQEDERWRFGGDASEIIGGVCNRRAFYSLRAESHDRLHIAHEQAYLNTVVATFSHVYYARSGQPIQAFDVATGQARASRQREPQQPARGGRLKNTEYACGHLVFVNNTGIPIDFWGFDDRSDTYLHWRAPAEVVEATPIDSDEDVVALFSVTIGDPEHGLYIERKIEHLFNAALSAAMAVIGGSGTAQDSLVVPPDKWGDHPPPRVPGLAIWNYRTDETRLVPLPGERGPTVWVPAQGGWLMMRTLPAEDQFDATHTRRTGRVLHRAFCLITRDGAIHELPSLALPAELDETATTTSYPPGGTPYASPQVYDPLIELSRVTPGQVIICDRRRIAAFDVFRQDYVWQCTNPLPLDAEPTSILPLPGNRVAARRQTSGWLIIDADGRIDPTEVWPANAYPALAGRCLLMGYFGRWRPLR